MTSDEFRAYLRNLQQRPYRWPNDYFAWEKPDKTLFMVGVISTQTFTLMKYEIDSFLNQRRADLGIEPANEYCAALYGISPKFSYMKSGNIPFDPVEELVDQVSQYRYLGSWRDPDRFMKAGYSTCIAHGRWDLAKEHILQAERKPTLGEKISQAQSRAAAQEPQQGRGEDGRHAPGSFEPELS